MNKYYSWLCFVIILLISEGSTSFAQPTAAFSATTRSGCAGGFSVHFNNLSTGATSYTWDFGDQTGGSALFEPDHAYQTAGIYTVTLTAINGAQSDIDSIPSYITVYANPIASFTMSDDSVCAGTFVNLVSTSTPGDTIINHYSWTCNDATPTDTSGSSITHQFNNGTSTLQIYFPVLIIRDAHNCNSTVSDTISVFPQPVANFTVSQLTSCTAPATITFTNTSLYTTNFHWNFGDPTSGANDSSILTSPSHTYNDTGTYSVTLIAGIPGCSSTQQRNITVRQPVANFSVPDTTPCLFDTLQFTNTGSTGLYNWNFDDITSGNNTSNLANPTHTFVAPGIHNVRLIVNIGGCSDTMFRQIYVQPLPVISFTSPDPTSCDTPYTVAFNDPTTSHIAWTWDFGDPLGTGPNSSTLQNPSHTYHTFGYFPIRLTVTDSMGCRNSNTQFNFVQIVQPYISIPTFSREDSGCVGSTFPFNATVVSPADPTITNYTWNFGDGTAPVSGAISSVTHTFNSPGIFNVTLTATTQSGCTASYTANQYIRIGTKPTAAITDIYDTICFSQFVQFTDSSFHPDSLTGWQWNFSDGGSSTAQNPNQQFNIDTTRTNAFDAYLIVYNKGCSDTDTLVRSITVLGPIPHFAINYNCANPLTSTFTNLSSGATSYVWDFGDASLIDTATNPTHTFPGSGDYTITLSATSTTTGCTVDTTDVAEIRVVLANINALPDSTCFPDSILFSPTGSQNSISQLWDFGTSTDTNASVYHTYLQPGYNTVILYATDIHGCVDSASKIIHMLGPTPGFISSPDSGCAPLGFVVMTDTSLTEGSSIVQWTWNYNNGAVIHTTTTGIDSLDYQIPGVFPISMIVQDANGCRDTATNFIRPTQPTAAIFTAFDTVCSNSPTLFTASAGAFAAQPVTYEWTYGDNTSSNGTTNPVLHTYPANGPYQVRLIVIDANLCRDTAIKNLFVYTTPAVISYTLNDTCVNQNGVRQAIVRTVLRSDSNNYISNYEWDLTVNSFSGPSYSSITYDFAVPPGTYDVNLIVTNRFGCKDTSLNPGLVVVPGPTGSFSFTPDSGCTPLTVNFQGSGVNASSYLWDFGDGTVIANTQTTILSHTYNTIGTYTPQFFLGFQLTNSFCYVPVPSSDSIQVTSLVTVDILEDSLFLRDGDSEPLHVLVNAPPNVTYTYDWTPTGVVEPNPDTLGAFYATTNGNSQYYYVNVPYSSSGCAGIDSVYIHYIACEDSLLIPNVFTPNGDSLNDTYHIDDLCASDKFKIIIYNRWGKIVYESSDRLFHWNGTTTDGDEVSDGTYYYVLHSRNKDYHGYIDIIRKRD